MQYPKIVTHNLILELPEESKVDLMCDFAIKNKQCFSLWEPRQSEAYYNEDYWYQRVQEINRDFQSDNSCCLNLYMKENHRLIGMVNFHQFVRGAFQSCVLGFKIAKLHQGKGLMSEALPSSINYIFESLNFHRISANYMPSNKSSARVLAKVGFKQEGIADDYLQINGKWERHVLTSLINTNYEN